MKIMSVNCGSSSVKMQLFEMPQEKLIAKFSFEKVNFENTFGFAYYNEKKIELVLNSLDNHSKCIWKAVEFCLNNSIIENVNDIVGIGHRVVMGADIFNESVLINDYVEEKIQELYTLAPLHNPANYEGIVSFKNLNAKIKQVACFDTSFHQTMPLVNQRFTINKKYSLEHKIQRYGAHGTSVKYVINEYAKKTNKNIEQLNVIVAHIGNGSSVTSVINGKSFDTSMGYSPLGGVMMGTRSGDLDPSCVLKLVEIHNGDVNLVNDILNKQSGLLGVSNLSNDMRDIIKNKDALEDSYLAYEMFVKRIIDYIGMYAIKYEKLDAVIFCAGIGENELHFHDSLKPYLKNIGIEMAQQKEVRNSLQFLSTKESKIDYVIIETNEELMIAKDTYEILQRG